MAETVLSLFEVSTKLGVSPSAIKKRVASLNIPVERGARGKFLFDEQSFDLLSRADELLKAGHGFDECRRLLGLDGAEPEAEAEAPEIEPAPEPEVEVVEAEAAPEPEAEATPAAEAAPEAEEMHEQEAVVPSAPAPEHDEPRALPMPVFIQLGRRKPSESVRARMAEQPTPTPMPRREPESPEAAEPTEAPVMTREVMREVRVEVPTVDPDLVARLDNALRLIEEKDKHNHQLQSKLMVAYDEMTKLSATAAAFQERSMNLQHEVQKLQSEIRLLTAPPPSKPWWKFWG